MPDDLKEKLLDAALSHVPFDGWGDTTFAEAAQDVGISIADARAVFSRGAVDLAVAYHRRGDQQMLDKLKASDLSAMRYSARVAAGVRFRLDSVADREILRRGVALFSMPANAAEGASLIWGTADHIWNALGDTSDDINWYSKRMILSGVYGSTVLFWLGDTSEGDAATWAFLDRRIEDVMRFEKVKAQVRENPILNKLFAFPNACLKDIKAPSGTSRADLPGHWQTTGRDNS